MKRLPKDEGLVRNGQVRTEGTDTGEGKSFECETDVREETKEIVRFFFTDLWCFNGDRGRGPNTVVRESLSGKCSLTSGD